MSVTLEGVLKKFTWPLFGNGNGTASNRYRNKMPVSGGFEVPLKKGGDRGLCFSTAFKHASVFLTALALFWGTARAEGPVSVPLEFTPQGTILVQGTIGDTMQARFILDTGSGYHIISRRAFESVESSPLGRFVGFGVNGNQEVNQMYELPVLSVGDQLEINPAVTYNSLLDSSAVDGVISAMIFRHRAITLDFREQRMVFEDSASLRQRMFEGIIVPVKIRDDRGKSLEIFFDVMIGENRVIECRFDTGAPTTIDERLMKSLKVEDANQWVGIDEKGESATAWSGRLEFIALAYAPTVGLDNPTVAFMPDLIYDGTIGWRFFTGRVVTFNLPEGFAIIRKQ